MKPRTLVWIFVVVGVALFGSIVVSELSNRAPGPDLDGIEGRTPEETAELRRRAEKDYWLRTSADSPVPPAHRDTFRSLPYYTYAPAFRLPARFVPDSLGARADTLTAQGGAQMVTAGTLVFDWAGQPQTLVAYWEEDAAKRRLFVPFRDGTTRQTTYGGGRYLSLPLPDDNRVVLDFNQAYHPYCVYDEAYICPVPPRQNTLRFSVTAGERL